MINFPIYEEIPEPYFQDIKNGMMIYGKTVVLIEPVVCVTDSIEEQEFQKKINDEFCQQWKKTYQCQAVLHEIPK